MFEMNCQILEKTEMSIKTRCGGRNYMIRQDDFYEINLSYTICTSN